MCVCDGGDACVLTFHWFILNMTCRGSVYSTSNSAVLKFRLLMCLSLSVSPLPALGLCPDWETWDPVKPVENATEAMQLADDWLGIPQVSSSVYDPKPSSTQCSLPGVPDACQG